MTALLVEEEFLLLVQDRGLGTYAPDTVTGNLFLGKLPDAPDLAVALALYPGPESDAKLGYDELRLQFRIRGPARDYRVGKTLAQQVYDELHGMPSRYLAGGTWMVDLIGQQAGPIDFGPDDHHRPEWTVNMRSELRRQTVHRA